MVNNLRKALENFLKENGITTSEIAYISIIRQFNTSRPYRVIDVFGWRVNKRSYYFWYFLQLKWLRFLMSNRKTFNLSLQILVKELRSVFNSKINI